MTAAALTTHTARAGSFEQEALPWFDDVYRFALSLTRDETDAEDVVQDTYLRAYRSWGTYAIGSDCRRWLFTICRNVFLRSRERERPTIELRDGERDMPPAFLGWSASSWNAVDDILFRTDLLPAVEQALSHVPPNFRQALLLVDIEGHSYETAAALLEAPVGTVRSRLFRGRRIMQRLLAAHALDAGFAGASRLPTGPH